MVSVLTSSAIGRIKPKTTKLIFVTSPSSTQHLLLLHQAHRIKEKGQSGWLRIRLMCPSGATWLTVNYCFSELAP